MMEKIVLKALNMPNRLISVLSKAIDPPWIKQLNKADKKIEKLEIKPNETKQLRVLMGPSFAIYPPSFVIDRSLSYAFRLRGAEVIPIYCDSVQHTECNYVGGEWGGRQNFKKNCLNCKRTSELLWQLNVNKPLPLSRYVSDADKTRLSATVSRMSYEEASSFEEEEIEYGRMAKDILVNNYLVATPSLVDDHKALLKTHLENLLTVSVAYARLLDELKPDRVVSNDSFYGMWAILEQQCKKRSIPFYSHWPATRNRVAFAADDAAMNLDFRASWGDFSKIPLGSADEEKIENWLMGQRGYVIDTTKLAGHETEEPILQDIEFEKQTLIIAANVIWDLAALNKQLVFNDMIDWILQTIEWFRDHGEYQLIIRPHPVELSPQIPKTKETVSSAIELSGVSLPKNVFLLKPDAKITLSELIERFDVRGVAVHTTTVGFECPARGIPVITTAKSPYRGFGFTIDPDSPEDYFSGIHDLLQGNRTTVSEDAQLLARKFIKFYHFHYYANIGLFSGNPPEIAGDFMEILSDDDGAFGYIVNSILEGVPINGRSRWIPET